MTRSVAEVFGHRGPLAIEPRAFFGLLFEPEPRERTRLDGSIGIVEVRGPLEHRASSWCDSYEQLLEDVRGLVDAGARTVVLDLDSPGGMVSGAFDTALALRTLAAAQGVRLVAYASGVAGSAAYALACACSEIVSSASAIVGSIGVIDVLLDTTAQDAAMGERWQLVTSGPRKADGAPHAPVTDAVVRARQVVVDSLARAFAALVVEGRGSRVPDPLALGAAIYTGADAVAVGLVDRVATLETFLAELREPGGVVPLNNKEGDMAQTSGAPRAEGGGEDPPQEQDARSRLARVLAEMDDEQVARALNALAAESDKPDEDPPSSEGDDPPKDAAAQAVSTLSAEVAKLRRESDAREMSALLAQRPDFDESFRAFVAKQPLDVARELVKHTPKGPTRVEKIAATVAPGGAARGQREDTGAPTSEASAEIDAALSRHKIHRGITRVGTKTIIGSLPREKKKEG